MLTVATKQRWYVRNPKKALLLFGTFLFLLLLSIGEFASRILFPSWAPTRADRSTLWSYDSLLGWAHEPNQTGTFNHPEFEGTVKLNSHGLRDKEYPQTSTGNKRMIVLGDSMGWGFGVENEEIFSEIIERRNPEWEIINASVSGYGTDQEYLYLQSKGIEFQPDVIVLLFHNNDIRNNARQHQYWYNKPMFALEDDELILTNVPVPPSSFKQEVRRYLLGRTYLFRKLFHGYLRLSELVFIALRSGDAGEYGDRTTERQSDHSEYEVTRRLLLKIDEEARQMQAKFVIVGVPMPSELRRMLTAFADESGIPYLALDAAFSEASEPVTFATDEHWNPFGHEVAANAIEGFLNQEELLP